ncbi:hypothetical protein GDO81_025472 [Engystomops pustulosus]|uniref:Uncharacterized protein n=1 Tax=Engystomops pustulosus TaxID=76066 RepID=A0AAV6YPM0_ENGPU|nr:hypothetical protein GDO81_025472 [Engystomops pustulosus]
MRIFRSRGLKGLEILYPLDAVGRLLLLSCPTGLSRVVPPEDDWLSSGFPGLLSVLDSWMTFFGYEEANFPGRRILLYSHPSPFDLHLSGL